MGGKEYPATLEERQEILTACLKYTRHRANKLARLMSPEMDSDDIQSEIGMKVWRAMIKKSYLKKSKTELIKIGYVTAKRHLAQLIRMRLTSRNHGAKNTYVPFHTKHVSTTVSLLLGKDYSHMSVPSKVFLFEAIRNEAIGLVGLSRHTYLLRALGHDWMTEELSPEQCFILSKTDYSQFSMMRALSLLGGRVMKKLLASEQDTDSQSTKVNGVWLQNTEVPGKILSNSV